jgi:MYXO-CTERM domain-containing protein
LTAVYVEDGGAIAPGALDFGDVPIRIAVDNDQQVSLQNCSLGQLELMTPDIPAPFAISDQFPSSLGPADSATFSITFHPTQVGPVDKELVVTSTDGTAFHVALRGNGVSGSGSGGDDTGPGDLTSFYACGGCSTDDPSGVLAVAFAMMCAVVSRRRRT